MGRVEINVEKYYKIKEELYAIFPDLKRIKPNPYGWPIVQKWNYRVVRKYMFGIFDFLYGKMCEEIEERGEKFFEELEEVDKVDKI